MFFSEPITCITKSIVIWLTWLFPALNTGCTSSLWVVIGLLHSCRCRDWLKNLLYYLCSSKGLCSPVLSLVLKSVFLSIYERIYCVMKFILCCFVFSTGGSDSSVSDGLPMHLIYAPEGLKMVSRIRNCLIILFIFGYFVLVSFEVLIKPSI